MSEILNSYGANLLSNLLAFLLRVAGTLLFLIAGLRVIHWVARAAVLSFQRTHLDLSLQRFLLSLIRVGLKILLFIIAASMVGIATTSLVAVVGAAGLAVGLALRHSLANFAGGVLLLLIKPFQVGDRIQAQGQSGTVEAIHMFYTMLRADDGQLVIIPNGSLANGVIVNFSSPSPRESLNTGVN
ncbi:MAG: hypothetical protein D6715_05530 [Calditrichaeota bacterium]|nr:MAG: hypothetical protein D6715_05530 [Calditrichota bacterium]